MNIQPNPKQYPKSQLQTSEHQNNTNTNDPQSQSQDQPYLQMFYDDQYIIDKRYRKEIRKFMEIDFDELNIEQLTKCIHSCDIIEQHRGIIGIRMLLIYQQLGFLDREFVSNKLFSKILWLMSQNDYPQIRLQACWAIATIAFWETEYCDKIIEMGCLHILRKLLQDNQVGVIYKAFQAITNLATDSTQHRDMILENGCLSLIVNIIEKTQDNEVFSIGCQTIFSLFNRQHDINKKYINQPCHLFCKIIKNQILQQEEDLQFVRDLLWSLQTMLRIDKTAINIIRKYQILEQFFEYAYESQFFIFLASVNIIGHFALGNQKEIDELINYGIYDLAMEILGYDLELVRVQMCQVLSNIVRFKSKAQIFMSQDDLLDKISQLFLTDGIEVKRQICRIYNNLTKVGNKRKIVLILLNRDIMKIYPKLFLQTNDQNTLQNLLQTLYNLLLVGKLSAIENINMLRERFIEGKGDQVLQNLQMHQSQKVSQLTIKIISQFFITQKDPKQM